MRQLQGFSTFKQAQRANIEAPLRPQGRVDTNPVGVHSCFL